MLRARADLAGYPLIIFGLSTGNLTRLQERKPMLIDLKPEYGIEAAILVMWGETEEAIQQDIEQNGLPVKVRGEAPTVLGPTGEFSDGKQLSPDDGGDIKFALSLDETNRIVRIDFGSPVNWIGLSPEEAVEIGHSITKKAYDLLHLEKLKVQAEKLRS